ncbi:MAG: hypothetical protein QOD74_2193 [Variibacter sp.]|jgi:hypothetical protein|nr:hypothetical protein [Variibacter sp.]
MSKNILATALLLACFAMAPAVVHAQDVQPDELRAANEPEEEFADEQRAMQADEEDNDPANAQRLLILDSRGRPYMYDGVRDGIVCRATRVRVRGDAWGRGVYKRTVRCNRR